MTEGGGDGVLVGLLVAPVEGETAAGGKDVTISDAVDAGDADEVVGVTAATAAGTVLAGVPTQAVRSDLLAVEDVVLDRSDFFLVTDRNLGLDLDLRLRGGDGDTKREDDGAAAATVGDGATLRALLSALISSLVPVRMVHVDLVGTTLAEDGDAIPVHAVALISLDVILFLDELLVLVGTASPDFSSLPLPPLRSLFCDDSLAAAAATACMASLTLRRDWICLMVAAETLGVAVAFALLLLDEEDTPDPVFDVTGITTGTTCFFLLPPTPPLVDGA